MARTLVRSLRTLLVVAVVLLWAAPDRANAWGWGYRGYYGYGYPGYYGYYPYYGSYGYYGYYQGYYSYGYPYYNYAWSYPYYGYLTYPTYTYPTYGYLTPANVPATSASTNTGSQTYQVGYSPASVSYYDVVPPQQAAVYTMSTTTDTSDSKAHITVLVPDTNAQVTVGDLKTSSTGKERHFQSPELAPGNYSYEVKATWGSDGDSVTKKYTVRIKPGTNSLVDFTAPEK